LKRLVPWVFWVWSLPDFEWHSEPFEEPMKTILVIAALMIFSVAPAAFAQTRPVSTASDNNVTRNDDTPRQHNYGWIGLIGLVGLAGLRRQKTEDVRRLEATGVNVKTVKTT
jgi:MYXO-CTERM domain-containing protein